MYLDYQQMYQGLIQYNETNSSGLRENEQKLCRKRMAEVIMIKQQKGLHPLLAFAPSDKDHCQKFLTLALDPEYKKLRYPFMALHRNDTDRGRELVPEYDSKVLLKMLVAVMKKKEDKKFEEQKNEETEQATAQTSDAFESDDYSMTCFRTNSVVSQEQKLQKVAEDELEVYQRSKCSALRPSEQRLSPV